MPLQGQPKLPVGYHDGRSLVPRRDSCVTGWDSVTLATISRSVSVPLI